jgi:hypothetical protein
MEDKTQVWALNNRNRYRLEAAQVKFLRRLVAATKSGYLGAQI